MGAVDVEGIGAILTVWGFARVALWSPEQNVVSDFEAEDFVDMLESVEPIWTE